MAGDGRRDQDGTLGVEVAAHQQSQPRRGSTLAVGDDDASGARHVVVRAGHRRAAECQRNRQRRCPRRRQRRRHRDVVAHATLAHQFRGHGGKGQRSRAGGAAVAGLSGRAGGTGVARRRTVLVRWARGAAGRVRARILVRRAVHAGTVRHPPGRAAAARLARPARQPRRAGRAGRRRASALLVLGAWLAKRLRRVRNAVRGAGVAGPVLLVLQGPAAQRRQDADDEGCQRRLPCLARRADRERWRPGTVPPGGDSAISKRGLSVATTVQLVCGSQGGAESPVANSKSTRSCTSAPTAPTAMRSVCPGRTSRSEPTSMVGGAAPATAAQASSQVDASAASVGRPLPVPSADEDNWRPPQTLSQWQVRPMGVWAQPRHQPKGIVLGAWCPTPCATMCE